MTDRNPTVVVTSDETLPDIVERLRGAAHGGQPVDLVVPIDSALLLTAREFRALKEAIDEDRLPVRIRTADPLRLHLAERLGIRAQTMPRPRVVAAPVVASAIPAADVPEAPPAGEEEWPGETVVAGPVLGPDPESHWPVHNGPVVAAGAEGGSDEPVAESDAEPTSENPPRRWLPVAAALAALVVAAALVIRFVVPQAVIRIVPRTAPVSGSLVFDVTADGQPLDDAAAFTLETQERQVEVVWEGTAPVTGVRVEPDGTASSAIELRNASAEPLVVDAGTTVATETGVEFTFSESVTVPAADAATGAPGAATGGVRASQPGSGSNVGTGELGGRLPNGVYYSNRMGPAEGGSDKEFPVVAQEDLDALQAAAVAAAPALVAAAVEEAQPGAEILTSTVSITGQGDEFDHQAGEEVAEVSLRATLTVDVLTFDGAAAAENSQQLLASRLADETPAGFAVGSEDITFGEPVAADERDGGVRLEVTASGEAEAVLDEAERAALAAQLAGVSPEQAATILAAAPDIAEYRVDYHPSWLAPQMPAYAGRILFEVAE